MATTQPGYIARKADFTRPLRRIEGQARGLQRMVEEDKHCIDIVTQVSAITSALQAVALGLLDEHLQHCIADAAVLEGPRGRPEARRSIGGDRPPRPLLNQKGSPSE